MSQALGCHYHHQSLFSSTVPPQQPAELQPQRTGEIGSPLSIGLLPSQMPTNRPVVKNSGSNWLEVTQKNVPCMWKVKNHIITNPWIVVFSETSKYTQLLTCKLPLQHKVWEIAQDFKTDLLQSAGAGASQMCVASLVGLVEESNLCAIRANCVTMGEENVCETPPWYIRCAVLSCFKKWNLVCYNKRDTTGNHSTRCNKAVPERQICFPWSKVTNRVPKMQCIGVKCTCWDQMIV